MSGAINIGPREDKKPTLRELEDALLESMEALRRCDTELTLRELEDALKESMEALRRCNPVFKRLRDLTDN